MGNRQKVENWVYEIIKQIDPTGINLKIYKEKVFGRFYRIDKARSRDKGGNGLGLSIAKQLVTSYRGNIWVESVENEGSIFYINFPIIKDEEKIKKLKKIASEKEMF